jgi:hypothetical protein
VRHRDQHLNGAASVVEADPAEVSQTALGEVLVVRGGCSWCSWWHGWAC